jgi:hypothetical protein
MYYEVTLQVMENRFSRFEGIIQKLRKAMPNRRHYPLKTNRICFI